MEIFFFLDSREEKSESEFPLNSLILDVNLSLPFGVVEEAEEKLRLAVQAHGML